MSDLTDTTVRFGFNQARETDHGLVVATLEQPDGCEQEHDGGLALIQSFAADDLAGLLCRLMGVAGLRRMTLPRHGRTSQAFWESVPPKLEALPLLPRIAVCKTNLPNRVCALACIAESVSREHGGRVGIRVPMNRDDVTRVAEGMMTALGFADVETLDDSGADKFVMKILRMTQPTSFLGKVWRGLCE